MIGERWNINFDIAPARGYRILMDGFPGLIDSANDFAENSAGLIYTETTIAGFHGYKEDGVPEFQRARKAAQYGRNVNDFIGIMEAGNNGGYTNNWLVADINANEIALVDLGLKNVGIQRTHDGFLYGCNFPTDPKLAAEETDYDPADPSKSNNARKMGWEAIEAPAR